MAITYDMSVKEFWEDDPDLFWAYRFSYFERLKQKQEIFNNNAWLQGAYFYEAISVALCNAFSKTKVEYSKQPYNLTKENNQNINLDERDQLVFRLKGRVSQVQTILKDNKKQEVIIGEKKTKQIQ